MKTTTGLSSRERVRLSLAHQEADRVPIAMICAGVTPPAMRDFQVYMRRERGVDAQSYLDALLDVRGAGPDYVGPKLPPGQDIWGVVRQAVSYGPGSYDEIERYPLAGAGSVADLLKHPWPSPALFDYASLDANIAAAQADGEKCLITSGGNIFETSWYMRGMENLMMDLILNPDFAHALLERVTDFYVEHVTRILEQARGRIDLSFTADDIAGQSGLLMSLDMWERFIKPCHVRLNRAIHQFGVKVVYHSDGAVMEAVPGLLDMGIDVLQALQFDAAGMDPAALKGRFGDRLCFEGGVSVQSTLPFGTVADVRAEVAERIAVLGEGGGYILGPSHAIQAGTPPENIAALFDTALDGK